MSKAEKRRAESKAGAKSAAGRRQGLAAKAQVKAGTSVPPSPRATVIVGVVASAGGLEAFIKMLEAMPPEGDMALVFVPHLDPGRESMMPDVLTRHSKMPVRQLVQGERLLANHVYVIPPNKYTWTPPASPQVK